MTRELSNYLTYGINWAYTTLGVFGGLIFGFFYSAIVVTGLHQSFPAIEIPAASFQRWRRRLHLPDCLHGERRAGRGCPGCLLQDP